MRFMIMHKNDPNTEAGQPPPMELVHKMGAFIGEHAAGGSVHRRRRPRREQDAHPPGLPQRAMHGEARPLSRRARAAGGDAAAQGPHARGGHRLGGALRQDPRRRRARARQGQRAVGHRPDAGAGESAAADAPHREGRPGHRGRRPQPAAEGRALSPQDRDDQGRRARPLASSCSRAPRASAWCSPTTTCG